MPKWVSILFALAPVASFSFGCVEVAKDTKVKCPKCGAVFAIDESLSEQQQSGRGGMQAYQSYWFYPPAEIEQKEGREV